MNNKHYLAAVGSFMMWGTFSIALRAMAGYLPGTILYYRILISALLLAGVLLSFKRGAAADNLRVFKALPPRRRMSVALNITVGGLLLAINWLVFIHVVNHVSIKTASFSYFICPVLTAVLAYLFLKEKLTRLQWLSVAVCAVSCLIIGKDSLKEAGYSLVIASSYAFYLILQRRNQGLDKLVVLFLQVGTALLIITPFYGQLVPDTPADGYFYAGAALIALFFTVLPLNMQLFALQKLNSATIGILMYINPMMNFLIAVWVYHETIGVYQGIGYVLILFAVVMYNYHTLLGWVKRKPGSPPVE